jgi:hypothetical protein
MNSGMADNVPVPAGNSPFSPPTAWTLAGPQFFVPDWPAPANVRALSTTRSGGFSAGAYAGFNLASHVGDDPLAVAANRQLLRSRLPVAPCWLNQVHGVKCVDVDTVWPGIEADAGLARNVVNACVVLTADCLPILLCDEGGSVVAAAHAGWRGLAAGVLEATVAAMQVPGGRLMAWLGPAIGPQAFEVGDEVRAAFVGADAVAAGAFVAHGKGKWLCDLYALARRRLARLGVERVFGGGQCTRANASRYYSYRRDGATGRMASMVWLEP